MEHTPISFTKTPWRARWTIAIDGASNGHVVLRRTVQFRIAVHRQPRPFVIQRVLPRPFRGERMSGLSPSVRWAYLPLEYHEAATAERDEDGRWAIIVEARTGAIRFDESPPLHATVAGDAGSGWVTVAPRKIDAELPASWTPEQQIFGVVAAFQAWLDALPSAG